MNARRVGWWGGGFGPRVQIYRNDYENQWIKEASARKKARQSARDYNNTHELLRREDGTYLVLESGVRATKTYPDKTNLMVALELRGIDTEALKKCEL